MKPNLPPPSKEERRAQALRDNLKRRKQTQADRSEGAAAQNPSSEDEA
jgi:hypothetical protein